MKKLYNTVESLKEFIAKNDYETRIIRKEISELKSFIQSHSKSEMVLYDTQDKLRKIFEDEKYESFTLQNKILSYKEKIGSLRNEIFLLKTQIFDSTEEISKLKTKKNNLKEKVFQLKNTKPSTFNWFSTRQTRRNSVTEFKSKKS